MIDIKGKHNTAKVFTENLEDSTKDQVTTICDQEIFKDSKIRIMPDCHAGMGCVIGTTMTVGDKVVPNLVGVDIGCGMLTVELGKVDLDLQQIDNYIKQNIPSGSNINQEPQIDYRKEIESLRCFREIPKSSKEFNRALGSLGGGNHFIEINIDSKNNKYLVVHSGSRNLGHQVASYYQRRAYDFHCGLDNEYEEEKEQLIEEFKDRGKRKQIKKELNKLKKAHKKKCELPKDLCFLEGELMEDYLHDMKIIQQYSNENRCVMAKRIVEEGMKLKLDELEKFQTIHNYIDLDSMILRKGATSSKQDEKILIPINMRDGSILARGKGNEDWNYSAPHGAGRLLSRTDAKNRFTLEDFKESMKGIYTSSVNKSTLDEAPMAYKDIEEILENTKDTIEVIDIIKPIYNYKNSK